MDFGCFFLPQEEEVAKKKAAEEVAGELESWRMKQDMNGDNIYCVYIYIIFNQI